MEGLLMVQHADIDHTGITGVGGAGGGLVSFDYNVYTAGDIALTATSPTAMTGPTDLTVSATAGDIVGVSLSALANNTTAASIGFNFATIVSAAPVNYLYSDGGTPQNSGVPGWFIAASAVNSAMGTFMYVVQAGDISGGNVVFRLYYRVSANRTLSASASIPLITQATNFGQP
jgi:hypothetical protein